MAAKTAQPPKRKSGGKAKDTTPKTVERDGGLHRVYARLTKEDKDTLDQLAAADERSTMKYLERLIRKHCEQARAKQGK
jgi:hypothetical protein